MLNEELHRLKTLVFNLDQYVKGLQVSETDFIGKLHERDLALKILDGREKDLENKVNETKIELESTRSTLETTWSDLDKT